MAEMVLFAAVSAAVQIGISYLFPSEGPRMRDLKVSASTYGIPIPKLYGTVRAAGNLLWSAKIVEHKEEKSAGKGGSYYNQYTYFATFAMAFCEGPADGLNKIWADSKLIYAGAATAPVTTGNPFMDALIVAAQLMNGTFVAPTTATSTTAFTATIAVGPSQANFYFGTEDQLPDTNIVKDKGAALTPAHRGLVYVVFENFPLQDFGNRIPTMAAEVVVASQTVTIKSTDINNSNPKFYVDLFTGYANQSAIFDFTRDRYFVNVPLDLTAPNGLESFGMSPLGKYLPGIARYNMTTGAMELYREWTDMGFFLGPNPIYMQSYPINGQQPRWINPAGALTFIAITVTGLLIGYYIRPTGASLNTSYGDQNCALCVINPDTLGVMWDGWQPDIRHNLGNPPVGDRTSPPDINFLHEFDGVNARVCANPDDAFSYLAWPNTPQFNSSVWTKPELRIYTVRNDTGVIDGPIYTYDFPEEVFANGLGFFKMVGVPSSTNRPKPGFYIALAISPNHADADDHPQFNVYYVDPETGFSDSLAVGGHPEITSFGATNRFDIYDVQYDYADPGILISGAYFTSGVSDVNRIMKYSEATGTMVYDIPPDLFSQGGFGVSGQYYPENSQLTTGRLGYPTTYTNDPIFHMIDTVTGDFELKTSASSWISQDDPDDVDFDASVTVFDGVSGLPLPQGHVDNIWYTDQTNLSAWDANRQRMLLAWGSINTATHPDLSEPFPPFGPALITIGATTGETTLGAIVESLLRTAGLKRAQFDVSQLNGVPVRGYGFAAQTDVKGIIEELRKLYLFDMIEMDGKLVGRIRGQVTSGSAIGPHGSLLSPPIPQAVLGSSSPEAFDYWEETRIQEAELPEVFSLTFMDINQDYQTSTSLSKRIVNPLPTMFSRQKVDLSANIVLNAAEAKAIVNRALYAQWLERTKHTTRLPWAYLGLDVADIITVAMEDGRSYTERIHLIEDGSDFTRRLETYGQDSGAYDLPAVVSTDGGGVSGGGTGSTGGQTLTNDGPARIFTINTTLIRDADSGGANSVYYVAVGRDGSNSFNAASIQRSTDGISYSQVGTETDEVEFGYVNSVFSAPAKGPFTLDKDTRLVVWPVNMSLSSCTDLELWNGSNPAVVGNEIIQYRDATLNDDGTWVLTNLLRGRRGTEWACDSHVAGELFIALDTETITGEIESISSTGLDRFSRLCKRAARLQAHGPPH
jgi:hypothetical protein